MKKRLMAAGCLIIMVMLYFGFAQAPPCDQYLDWCLFTWCPGHTHNPDQMLECQNQYVANWIDYCQHRS